MATTVKLGASPWPTKEWPTREPWKMEAALLRIIQTENKSLAASKAWASEALRLYRHQPHVSREGYCGPLYPALPATESEARAEAHGYGWPPVPDPTRKGRWRPSDGE
jgi:hypothetical protein